jgi:hypothetical protein
MTKVPPPIEVAKPEAKRRLENLDLPRLSLPLIPGGVTDSDVAILRSLAEARSGPMTLDELSDSTGYSERTIRRRVDGLKMNDKIREGGLLSSVGEDGGVWFKGVETAEEVGEYFAMQDLHTSESEE